MSNAIDWKKDIYKWRLGCDDTDLRILTALNNIIDFLYDLDDITYITHEMNTHADIDRMVGDVVCDLDPAEVASKLEIVRTLLFGSKVDYNTLQKALEDGLHKYGYIKPSERNE